MTNFRELSKSHYSGPPSLDNINCGSIQRIADATELMATNFLKLQSDNEYLRKRNQSLNKENERLQRSANSYKGKYNNLKNKSCQNLKQNTK
ncbi:hypothetical protein [uncultured Flavobacterium sp.]|uniref:hypothetical protein n=1 Tax=uncultured Flavobacterium sp. TaxID=165435 RepID=UPI0030EC801D|tara:strand:+ start:11293 stop:11568 length:276 start_codon:yes stop_codon:yes gene_type:complete